MKATLPLLALCIPIAAHAQAIKDTARIAPVVVTATRSPLAAERAPSSVSMITGAQLRAQGITTVSDALRQVPGLAVVQTGSYGGATSLFIRGGESKFTKVLIDGVPVNDAGGAFDFSTLSTDNLDRIEIVRGPASVLYGSDAMAGVIQLFTTRGTSGTHGDVSARAGGFGSHDADAALRGGNGALTYSIAGARHSTDGIQAFNSAYHQSVGSALVGARGAQSDVALSLRYSDNEVHYPTDGSGQVVDSNAVHNDDRLSIGIDAGVRLTSAIEVRLALASYNAHGLTSDQPDSPADSNGYYYSTPDKSQRRSGDIRIAFALPSASTLTVGTQVETEWQADARTTDNLGGSVTPAQRRRTSGVYAQLLSTPFDIVTTTVGGRYEHNERFGDFFTYRAAASAQVVPDTRLRGSVGTAFREPSFLENYGSAFAIGNPALSPEHALSFDAGVEQRIGRDLTVGLTGFQNSFRDLIDYSYSETAPNYNNIARTRTRGLELESRIATDLGLHADGALTYLDTRVIDAGSGAGVAAAFASGARLLRRPMHTFDLGAGYGVPRGSIDLRVHRVGTRDDSYYAGESVQRVTLAPYTRSDLSAQLRLVENAQGSVAATLRAENVFDALYTDVSGFNYDFARTDDASIAATGYRAPGRRILAGLRFMF
ncbi:MAG: TonB-dependent receptor [Gemmatimonadota bacterium]|nr:TonB-dependent receptor [Gemmatimonadota bacterium]